MPRLICRMAMWFAIAGCLAACAAALLVAASIVGRSLLAHPVAGDVELTQFAVSLSIALCLPWCQLQRANIIVEFFTQALPERSARRLDGVGSLLLALMVGLLAARTSAGALAVYEAHETTMILELPMWPTYAVLAPGLALTALIALLQAVRQFRGLPVTVDAA